MSAPLVPSPLDYIGRRSFGFYPAIRNVDPNTWRLGTGSWSEVQVLNAATGAELWIPRRYIGAVSDQQTLTVGLTETLQVLHGEVTPRTSGRVIQMPRRSDGPSKREQGKPAAVVGIRLESKARRPFQSKAFRIGLMILFVTGLLAMVTAASR